MKTAFTSRLPHSNDPKTDSNKVFDAIHGINYIIWDLNRALDACSREKGQALRELRVQTHIAKQNLSALNSYLSRASDVQ